MLSRKRIGILIPSTNTTVEAEFYSLGIDEVTFHAARLYNPPSGGEERLLNMLKFAKEGTKKLMTADVDAIIYGCTSGSFIKGPGFEKEVEKTIREVAHKIPIITASSAVVEALNSFQVKNVSIGTPYTKEVTEKAKIFLQGYHFKVVKTMSLPLRNSSEKGNIQYRETIDMANAINIPEAEAIVIMCTALPTFGIIKKIEDKISKPVITSNQASLWFALKKLRIYKPMVELGSLFY